MQNCFFYFHIFLLCQNKFLFPLCIWKKEGQTKEKITWSKRYLLIPSNNYLALFLHILSRKIGPDYHNQNVLTCGKSYIYLLERYSLLVVLLVFLHCLHFSCFLWSQHDPRFVEVSVGRPLGSNHFAFQSHWVYREVAKSVPKRSKVHLRMRTEIS